MKPLFFDQSILHFFNQFANRSPWFDHFIYMIADNNLLKGGVMFSVCWYIWFTYPGAQMQKTRKGVLTTFLVAFVAEATCIILSLTLPYRARPFLNPELALNIPLKLDKWWDTISSFPSDHGTLFMAISFGIWQTNKKFGWACLLYTIIFIYFPRMYLGLHYPSDILGGALIGICFVLIGFNVKFISTGTDYILKFAEQKPHFFYPLLFLLTYQLSDLFLDTRELLGFIRHPLGK
ncbi:MAG: phosphatase PAP2 family protein [Bacteroidetes bacterium]|nr:phosphatase PAP2 family protein [Bacteroidota bacterium]